MSGPLGDDQRENLPPPEEEDATLMEGGVAEPSAEASETDEHADPGASTMFASTFATDRHPSTRRHRDLGTLGDYELVEQLGQGAMGVVYRAHQQNPHRDVAIKIIRPERLESRTPESQQAIIDRFRNEAQAAAHLRHDNIVTIFEVGKIESQPYFSMTFVDGASLHQLLRDGPLENRRAAAYMEAIARAIHHAHTYGVLHRDLKPQNIIVDRHNDRPLVTDFGLAKFTETDSALTRHGEVLGTPQYMAPEQAQGKESVDARADIYALGATLYHLVAGRPPFQAASPLQTLKQLVTEEPVAPRSLNPAIDVDLETICLKCLEKEPHQRYQTAQDVADELQRYLNREPIKARPLRWPTRLLRWGRRRPLVASLASLSIISVVVAFSVWVMAVARTEASFNLAYKSIDDFFTNVSENVLLHQPGATEERQELLRKALDFFTDFVALRGDDPRLREEIALTHFRIGRIKDELESPAAAMPHYHQALELQQALIDDDARASRRAALADTWNAIGRAQHRRLAFDQAVASYAEAQRLREDLAQSAPPAEWAEANRKWANTTMNAGLLDWDRQRLDAALESFAAAQSRRQEILSREESPRVKRDLAMGYFNSFNLLFEEENDAAALSELHMAIESFEQLLRDQPYDLRNQHRLAVCYRSRGDLSQTLEDAHESYRRARQVLEPLARQNVNVVPYQVELAVTLVKVADMEDQMENLQVARQEQELARRIITGIVDSASRDQQIELASTLINLSELEARQEKFPQAATDLDTARQILEAIHQITPNDERVARLLDVIDQLETSLTPSREVRRRPGDSRSVSLG